MADLKVSEEALADALDGTELFRLVQGGLTKAGTALQIKNYVGAQPLDADLTAIAALSSAADKIAYATGAQTWALADFTAAGRTLVGAANAAAQITALGLGALATVTPGTGIAAALAINVGSAGAPVLFNGALGTPSSGTLTNCTGLPTSGIASLGTGVATAMGNAVNAAGGFLTHGSAAVLTANTFTATQTINPAANTSALIISGGSITGSGTTVPGITVAGTVNTSGIVVGAALFSNLTMTAAAATSTHIDIQEGSASYLKLMTSKGTIPGALLLGGNGVSAGIGIVGANWSSTDVLELGCKVGSSSTAVTNGAKFIVLNSDGTKGYAFSGTAAGTITIDMELVRYDANTLATTSASGGAFRDHLIRSVILTGTSATTAGAAQISLSGGTQSTVGAAGGASALPATPSGYMKINVAGTAMVVPYYAAS